MTENKINQENETKGEIVVGPGDERTWAMLAHLSVIINIFTGILGVFAALTIYLVYKDRSKYIAYQAMQSLIMQSICWIGAVAAAGVLWTLAGGIISMMWSVIGALSAIVIGIILIPVGVVLTIIFMVLPLAFICLPIVNLIYSIVAAVQTNEGRDFQYWQIGSWIRQTYQNPAV